MPTIIQWCHYEDDLVIPFLAEFRGAKGAGVGKTVGGSDHLSIDDWPLRFYH